MRICNIAAFERKNNIAINVLSWIETPIVDTKEHIFKHPFVNFLYKSKNTRINTNKFNFDSKRIKLSLYWCD